MIVFASGRRGIVSPGARPCARSPIGPPPCQTPVKSIEPSGKRGAGPAGALGTLRFPPLPAGEVAAPALLGPVGSGAGGCCAASEIAAAHVAALIRLKKCLRT